MNIDELLDKLEELKLKGSDVFFTRAREHTEHLYSDGKVTVNVNPYYGYIDVLGLSEDEQKEFREKAIKRKMFPTIDGDFVKYL